MSYLIVNVRNQVADCRLNFRGCKTKKHGTRDVLKNRKQQRNYRQGV